MSQFFGNVKCANLSVYHPQKFLQKCCRFDCSHLYDFQTFNFSCDPYVVIRLHHLGFSTSTPSRQVTESGQPIPFILAEEYGLGFVLSDLVSQKIWDSGWWFQIFVIFTPIWGRFPCWLIFFKGVETTNQDLIFWLGRSFWLSKDMIWYPPGN